MWCLNIGIYWNRISSMVVCDMIHRHFNSSILRLSLHQYLKIIATKVRSTVQITQNKHPAVQFFCRCLPPWSFASQLRISWMAFFTKNFRLTCRKRCVEWFRCLLRCLFMGTLAMGPPSEISSRAITYHQINWFPYDFYCIAWDRFPWASHEEAWHGFLMLFGSSG